MALGVHPCSIQVLSTSVAGNISELEVSTDFTFVWDIAVGIQNEFTAVWDIKTGVERDYAFIWDIRELAAKNFTAKWDITFPREYEFTFVWDISDKNAFVVDRNRYCPGGTSRTKPFCG